MKNVVARSWNVSDNDLYRCRRVDKHNVRIRLRSSTVPIEELDRLARLLKSAHELYVGKWDLIDFGEDALNDAEASGPSH
jgi:hypothetical protein